MTELSKAKEGRDLVAYSMSGLILAMVETDTIPPVHRERARELVDEYRRRDAICQAVIGGLSPAPAEAPSGPSKAVSA